MTGVDDRRQGRATDSAAARFRAFARRHHPDVGGDPETFRLGVEAFREGRSPFVATGQPDPDTEHAAEASGPHRTIPDDDPRLNAPVVAVSGHVVPRTLRAGRRFIGRGPLHPVRHRRVL